MVRGSILMILLLALPAPGQEKADLAPGLSQQTFAEMDGMLGRALEAYNAGDWKAFYKDWAQLMSSITNEQTFKSLYADRYKKTFGDYRSRQLVPERSTVSGDNAVVFYKASFSKKEGEIGVNYYREKGKWRLQQIQFN